MDYENGTKNKKIGMKDKKRVEKLPCLCSFSFFLSFFKSVERGCRLKGEFSGWNRRCTNPWGPALPN